MSSWQVRDARDRFVTRTPWLISSHSFSFGGHYDPSNLDFGLLLANNDDVVAAGGGYGTHEHRDLEIVTWVVSGALRHEDSLGHRDVLTAGMAQATTAGTGIRHSERNADGRPGGTPLRFVQMWLQPGHRGCVPRHHVADLRERLGRGGLVAVVGPGGPLHVDQPSARLSVAMLQPAQTVVLPPAPGRHVYVVRGGCAVGTGRRSGEVGPGDAVRVRGDAGAGPLEITAGPEGAEALVWSFGASARPQSP